MAGAPAKRRKLTPTELELLDLDDDVLIEIFDKLDHKSKMQMMLSCRRFEGLIGNTFQFYKNFKLLMTVKRMPIEPHYSSRFKIRRKFGYVILTGTLKAIYRSQVFEILKSIGESVIKLRMSRCEECDDSIARFDEIHLSEADFLKLLRFMPNLRELSTNGLFKVDVDALSVQPVVVDFQLKSLNSFTCNINLGCLNALIPPSLASLLFLGVDVDGSSMAEILTKQQKLDSLSLNCLKMCVFKYQPSNCHIKNLVIEYVEFPIKSVFLKFSDFMKTQKSVKEFEFKASVDELKSNNDYTEFLTHIWNLKTLKKLVIHCQNLIFTPTSKINICNPSVEILTIYIPPTRADLQKLPNSFPNITDLHIYWDYKSEQILAKLELKKMLKFHLTSFGVDPFPNYYYFTDDSLDEAPLPSEILETRSACWKAFVNNNCQL
jgi:hypothetical protein